MKNVLVITLVLLLLGCDSHPKVEVKTSEGDIIVEVFEDKVPLTASSFLNLVDDNIYDSAFFYRVVTLTNQDKNSTKIEVVQGGLYHDERVNMMKVIRHESTDETGILHKDGVISMARLEPGTASSEFFICIGAQPELDYVGERNMDGQGFAAFGRVIKGMDVVKKIHKQKNTNQILDTMVKIDSIRRI